MVAAACKPDAPADLSEMLFALTRQMSGDPNAPEGVRALGRVLNAILTGDRAPDLAGLPPELADAVRQVLAALS